MQAFGAEVTIMGGGTGSVRAVGVVVLLTRRGDRLRQLRQRGTVESWGSMATSPINATFTGERQPERSPHGAGHDR